MKNKKPLIGLTAVYNNFNRNEYYLSEKYGEFIRAQGGLPIIFQHVGKGEVDQLAETIDGAVLTGGADIPPDVYGQSQQSGLTLASLAQVQFELLLIKAMLRRKKPILGICLGHQLLNIAFGGTLIQDIPTMVPRALQHDYLSNGKSAQFRGRRHMVYLEGPSRLRDTLQTDKLRAVSSHHQSVKTVGRGVRIIARTSDGVVEATQFPTEQLILSVQWHPEVEKESIHSQRIFGALVAASAEQDSPSVPRRSRSANPATVNA